MITIAQDKKARELIAVNLTDSEIARRVGISRWSVSHVRSAIELIGSLSESETSESLRLLKDGLPVGVIELRTRIPREKILAMRRHYYLHKREPCGSKPRKCITCGSIIMPIGSKKRLRIKRKPNTGVITSHDIMALYSVVEDVAELGRLNLITNALFYHLTRRAEHILEEVNDKKTHAA